MGLTETLTLGLGSAVMKALAKIWLKDNEVGQGLALCGRVISAP